MKDKTIGFSFSQDPNLTKMVLVLPTQTAKNLLYWVILPTISSAIVWGPAVLPMINGIPSSPAHPVAEQIQHP